VLEFCAESFTGGAGSFFFGDATFTMNRKRLARILDLLPGIPYTYHIQTRADYLDRATIDALASKGFTDVALGAETFNEEILQRVVRKRLEVADVLDAALSIRDAGMNPMLTFIVGLPGETRASILNTVDVLRKNEIHTATFFPLVVFKGTALFEEFASGASALDMERVRLNPMSEEFLFVSPEFPDREALTGFADEVNAMVAAP
jgi:anaerobic magnesium-protoporphyrin IX monomethyl ester cyclase